MCLKVTHFHSKVNNFIPAMKILVCVGLVMAGRGGGSGYHGVFFSYLFIPYWHVIHATIRNWRLP